MCWLDLIKFWLSHFQFHAFSDSVCFGLDSRTFVIEATEWIGFLARGAGLIMLFILVRAVWKHFIAAAKSSRP